MAKCPNGNSIGSWKVTHLSLVTTMAKTLACVISIQFDLIALVFTSYELQVWLLSFAFALYFNGECVWVSDQLCGPTRM